MTDRTFHRAALLLALTTWLVYAATATGSLSIDPNTRFTVAESLLLSGDVALEESNRLTVEHEGRHYSVFFPGQSVVFLPVAGTGVVARMLGASPDMAFTASRFAASVLYIPAFAALAVLGHVVLLRLLGVRPRVTLVGGAILAFATPLWGWGTTGSEETVLAALGIWAFVAIIDAGRRLDAGDASRVVANRLGWAAWLLALGLIHRTTFGTVVIGAAIVIAPILFRARAVLLGQWPRLAAWAAASLATLAIVPLYNHVRFGDAFDNGYAAFYEPFGGIFETPLIVGLTGLLFSPGKSVFLYVPWLVLLPVALIAGSARRRLGVLAWAIVAMIVTHLLVYGLHTFWSGAFGWGVRFHVSLLPLVLVPIVVWLDAVRPGRVATAGLATLAAFSLVVQVAGMSFNMGLEHIQHPERYSGYSNYEGIIPLDAAWTWEQSHWRLRFVNIGIKLRGGELLELEADDPAQIRAVWNLFPLRAAVALDDRRMVTVLWVIWSILVAGAIGAAIGFGRGWVALETSKRRNVETSKSEYGKRD